MTRGCCSDDSDSSSDDSSFYKSNRCGKCEKKEKYTCSRCEKTKKSRCSYENCHSNKNSCKHERKKECKKTDPEKKVGQCIIITINK